MGLILRIFLRLMCAVLSDFLCSLLWVIYVDTAFSNISCSLVVGIYVQILVGNLVSYLSSGLSNL